MIRQVLVRTGSALICLSGRISSLAADSHGHAGAANPWSVVSVKSNVCDIRDMHSSPQETCPIHVLGAAFNEYRQGEAVFSGITPSDALGNLRFLLSQVGVKDCMEFRTHDLRRGHALDLQLSHAPLYEILEAGEWKSPAFMSYLDMHRLERDAVIQAHIDESDGED